MSTPSWDDHRALHDSAMECVDEAMKFHRQGFPQASRRMYRMAFIRERRAAELWPPHWFKGVVWRSAGWIALNCGQTDNARFCARAGLALDGLPGCVRGDLEEVLAAADGRKDEVVA